MRISDWSSDVCSSDLLLKKILFPWRKLSGIYPPRQWRDEWAFGLQRNSTITSRFASSPTRKRDSRRSLRSTRRHAGRRPAARASKVMRARSEEHTSELQSLMRIAYAVFCLHKKKEANKKKAHG